MTTPDLRAAAQALADVLPKPDGPVYPYYHAKEELAALRATLAAPSAVAAEDARPDIAAWVKEQNYHRGGPATEAEISGVAFRRHGAFSVDSMTLAQWLDVVNCVLESRHPAPAVAEPARVLDLFAEASAWMKSTRKSLNEDVPDLLGWLTGAVNSCLSGVPAPAVAAEAGQWERWRDEQAKHARGEPACLKCTPYRDFTTGKFERRPCECATQPAPPSQGQETSLLDNMPTNWELSWGSEDEESPSEWRVHVVEGSPNDREWRLIGSGKTPFTALLRAAAAPTQPPAEGG